MSQAFSGKIKSARFADSPTNSVIEILYSQEGDSVLTQFHLHVNFSDPTFLDFIEEWPLEKIEQAAKDVSKQAALNAEEARKDWNMTPVQRLKPKDILQIIDKHSSNKEMLFEYKLVILEELSATKDKSKQLKIRKSKTLKELLGLYYGV